MMDFQQAGSQFKQLKAQYKAGKITESEFKAQLEELMVQDEGGTWWMIGYETEKWYRYDGSDWVQADPPGSFSQKLKPIVPTESEVTERKSRDKTDQDIDGKATRVKAELEEKTYTEKEGLRKPSWKRWIFGLMVLITFSFVGFGVGGLICSITSCDIEPWLGAVPTWLLGIYLTYKVWKRYSGA